MTTTNGTTDDKSIITSHMDESNNTDAATSSKMETNQTKSLFKQNKRKPQLRKRALEETQHEEEEDPLEKERLKLIELTKDIQKLRDRKKGIDHNTALKLPVLLEGAPTSSTTPTQSVPKEQSIETNNIVTALQNQFTQEKEPTIEDKFLSKYVEEKMQVLKSQDIKNMKDFQALLEAEKIENDLRREKEAHKADAKLSQPVSLTSVAEVELPNKYKIENIIETEKATQALAQKQQMLEEIKQQLLAEGMLDTPQFRFQQDTTGPSDPIPQVLQDHLLPEDLSHIVVPPKSKSQKPSDGILFEKYVKKGKKE